MMGESSSMIDYEYIHKKNSKILVRAGHQYCLKKKYKNGADIWECAKRKKEKCNGSITIQVSSYYLHLISEIDFIAL